MEEINEHVMKVKVKVAEDVYDNDNDEEEVSMASRLCWESVTAAVS